MNIQTGNAKIIPKERATGSPALIGKYMKIKHSKNDMIVFCMNDNFLLRPLAQLLHIHQYFLMNLIISKLSKI